MKTKFKVVIVSGYFNPLHVGHIRLLRDAAKLGDYLFVIINNDMQVAIKGSVPFMSAKDRAEIVGSLKFVDETFISVDKNESVSRTLDWCVSALKSMKEFDFKLIFANGGDRKSKMDIPEKRICEIHGIQMVFGVGGNKVQSSSKLIKKAIKKNE